MAKQPSDGELADPRLQAASRPDRACRIEASTGAWRSSPAGYDAA
jgi:hypothetical protein